MTSGSLLVGVVIGFLFSAGTMVYVANREKRLAQADLLRAVRDRLGHYANMKSACATIYHPADRNPQFVPSAYLLDARQHDILLGALKKIETKTAAAAVVFVLGFDLLVGHLPECAAPVPNFIWGLVGGSMFAALLAILDGAAHLGQRHFRTLNCDVAIRGRELQRSLIMDMIKKEARFQGLYWIVIAVVILAVSRWVAPLVAEIVPDWQAYVQCSPQNLCSNSRSDQ